MILYDDCISSSRLTYRNQCVTHTLRVSSLSLDLHGGAADCMGIIDVLV
jgi:hypothetical protein